jgi:hypothetical protein
LDLRMITGFKDVTISWKGKSYTIPANEQMGLIKVIEEALSGDSGRQAVGVLLAPEGPPYARLASAFGAALRYGGSTVEDGEIYLSMMEDMADQKADVVVLVQSCIMALLSIISPPMSARITQMGSDGGKKPEPTTS